MSEVRTEHADVESTPISDAQHGLGIKRIGEAQTRSERFVSVIDVAIEANRTLTRYADHALIQVREAAVVFSIHAFREIDFPTQPVSHSEFRTDPPSILSVEEPAFLPLRSGQAGADEPLEGGHVPKQ